MSRRFAPAICVALLVCLMGADYRTANFRVVAPTPALAKEVAQTAERFRRQLALEWLGRELPPWTAPCTIEARIASHLKPNGLTTYQLAQGRAFGWRIDVQGSPEHVLESVLPHEITHTIFASYFGRPLPRWADEGVSIIVESDMAQQEQQRRLVEYLSTGRGISFAQMFRLTEYPPDMLPLYSQGYSLVRFLVDRGGRRKFVLFMEEGMRTNNWALCTQKHYAYENLHHLQHSWLDWVAASSTQPQTTLISTRGAEPPVMRVESPLVASDQSLTP